MAKTKTKWIQIISPISFYEMHNRLSKLLFGPNSSIGIELFEIQKDYITGKFVEEILETESYIDPFGNEVINQTRRYLNFSFSIHKVSETRFLVCVSNPPRNIKSFITSLSNSIGFGFSAAHLPLDIFDFIEKLKKYLNTHHCVVKSVRIGNVRIGETTISRMEAISTIDAYAELRNAINLDGSTIEKTCVEIRSQDYFGKLEIYSTGVLQGENSIVDRLTPMCIEFFREIC